MNKSESYQNLVLIPLIILSVAIALFFGFTMMFYIKSVKDMISTKVTKFMFRIILVGLLLTCTVILVLADTVSFNNVSRLQSLFQWMILFGEELGDLEELVHVILPIPVTLFAFIHFIRRSLTSSCVSETQSRNVSMSSISAPELSEAVPMQNR